MLHFYEKVEYNGIKKEREITIVAISLFVHPQRFELWTH